MTRSPHVRRRTPAGDRDNGYRSRGSPAVPALYARPVGAASGLVHSPGRDENRSRGAGARLRRNDMLEVLTAIAAAIGSVTLLVSAIGVLIVNSKVDRLTGRVDTLEKTVLAKL